jgi:hypothetical protein
LIEGNILETGERPHRLNSRAGNSTTPSGSNELSPEKSSSGIEDDDYIKDSTKRSQDEIDQRIFEYEEGDRIVNSTLRIIGIEDFE